MKAKEILKTENPDPSYEERAEKLRYAIGYPRTEECIRFQLVVPYKPEVIQQALSHIDVNRCKAIMSDTADERAYWDACHTIVRKIVFAVLMASQEQREKNARKAKKEAEEVK